MDKLVLDDDTKALVLAVRDLLKDLRARGLNDDQIDTLVKVVKSSSAVQERYISAPYVIPYNDAQFVISVGFKLGTRDSKGNNILRVF